MQQDMGVIGADSRFRARRFFSEDTIESARLLKITKESKTDYDVQFSSLCDGN